MMFDEVVGAVAGAKAGDPLASVTVVVPTHAAGRDVLHALARAGAVANTGIVTLRQVVERLAGPVLKPRQALPYPVLEAAVARVLEERPGKFEEVAGAPITTRALAQAAWRLTELADPRIDDPTPLVDDMLRVYREAHGNSNSSPGTSARSSGARTGADSPNRRPARHPPRTGIPARQRPCTTTSKH